MRKPTWKPRPDLHFIELQTAVFCVSCERISRNCTPACLGCGSRAVLSGGLTVNLYAAAVVLLGLLGIAMAGLMARALMTGEWSGALFLVGFAVLFAWQIGGFVMRNRPIAYAFDRLPKALLP